MSKCRRIISGPKQPSLYGKSRKEPRSDGSSTIEAAGMVLSRLEGRAEIETELNATFQRMSTQYRAVQSSMPESAPKPKKRDYRRPENRRGKAAKG
ncbi:hypothetical protein OY671_010568 [Metschnikowia pulcherrima]|nr:hypothetical protein OY671_010568 [Metschnikowia pulcherrima]